MTDRQSSPRPRTTFAELARHHRVVPVTRRLLADGETPVGVYRKLAGGPGTFLLESAEQGAGVAGTAWSRYSFVGVRSAATLTERDGRGALAGHAAGRACRPTATRSTCCGETVAALTGRGATPTSCRR